MMTNDVFAYIYIKYLFIVYINHHMNGAHTADLQASKLTFPGRIGRSTGARLKLGAFFGWKMMEILWMVAKSCTILWYVTYIEAS